MTITKIAYVSVHVEDQDEALQWYTQKLGFVVREDDNSTVPGFRWLTVSPQDDDSTKLVIYGCTSEEDKQKIGKNPMFILNTDDCKGDCQKLEAAGVSIVSPVEEVPWGISAIFVDLYGNAYNLVQSNFQY